MSIAAQAGAWSRRRVAKMLVDSTLDLHVVGLEQVPASGPAILIARHYHHLYDGAAILATLPREVHLLVAVDWLGRGQRLRLMRRLAAAARWPAVWRGGTGTRLNRDAYRLSLSLLREGRVLLILPEAYPVIDPARGQTALRTDLRPFDAGFLVLAERAGCTVPIVPVGLHYAARPGGGWRVQLRFGRAYRLVSPNRRERRARLADIQAAVCRLSLPDLAVHA